VNPTALVPVTLPGNLREDRVGQLVKRVLAGVTSEKTRRAYRHALEMFLGLCDREGIRCSRPSRSRATGACGRGTEVVLHGRSSSGGHYSSDPRRSWPR
jgi:hypothetical protein